jgi:hypothetical protein
LRVELGNRERLDAAQLNLNIRKEKTMGCIYNDFNGVCSFYDEDSSLNPEGCDSEGYCLADEDEDPSWCSDYQSVYDEDVCDYCGEPLGFCSEDCETREKDFEE